MSSYFRDMGVAREQLGLSVFDGASLADPNADRVMFWDDSAGALTWLAPSTHLEISGTDLRVTDASRLAAIFFVIDGGGGGRTGDFGAADGTGKVGRQGIIVISYEP